MEKAEEKFRQQTAVYEKACKEEKERVRKIQNRHKYMMGGCAHLPLSVLCHTVSIGSCLIDRKRGAGMAVKNISTRMKNCC